MNSANAIVCEGLARSFKTIRAVDGISLSVAAGTVFSLLGANGAGKTTTIHLLLGLLEPSEGTATVLGFDSRTEGEKIRNRCGALLEHHGLYERLTAADNLELYGRIFRMTAADRTARARELLTHFDLWDRRHDRVGTWSRGMKQKLAIARAILHRPAILFLDEPTAGLDPEAAVAVRNDIADLASSGQTTIFLNTHNLTEAELLSNQVAIMRDGKLLAVGTPAELAASAGPPTVMISGRGWTPAVLTALRARPEVASVSAVDGQIALSLSEAGSIAPLVRELVSMGVDVEEVHKNVRRLEDTFLAVIQEDRNV